MGRRSTRRARRGSRVLWDVCNRTHGATERKYDRKTSLKQPGWRTAGNGFTHEAYYLTIDTAVHDKPFQLTFIGTREDKVEIEAELYLE